MSKARRPKRSDSQELQRLLEDAQSGDKAAVAKLRERLKARSGVWEELGDLAKHALTAQLALIVGDHELLKDAVATNLETMRAELEGPECSPLERLLVQRILACWLQVTHADMICAQRAPDLTLAQGDYYQRRQDRAHRRLLSAIRTLATVRKLALPVLQLNVAQQQVNIAQAALGERPADPEVAVEVG